MNHSTGSAPSRSACAPIPTSFRKQGPQAGHGLPRVRPVAGRGLHRHHRRSRCLSKTTLVRNLFNKLSSEQIVAAHIVNTHLDSDDTLRMVVSAFGLPYENVSKADLLTRLEQFLRASDQQG
ncbi:hypothetical protein LP420_19065 [Massilia sp. B-10]|nr:hypothetical protein LP420_19065 [Massilia sp. B-10]UUZ56820.1 hypothetical protein LP419_18500 [Massilia sp. H-1]